MRILIQGAMDVEIGQMLQLIKITKSNSVNGFLFWEGTVSDIDIVVSQTGIGTIHCAAATALGLALYRPDYVINQGIAGAHSRELHIGDIVIGESCVNIHDAEFPDNDSVNVPIYNASEKLALCFERQYYSGRKILGRLGSGDVFNLDVAKIDHIHKTMQTLCEDMESIAAYQICAKAGVPCCGIRIISNNELTGETYKRDIAIDLQFLIINSLSDIRKQV